MAFVHKGKNGSNSETYFPPYIRWSHLNNLIINKIYLLTQRMALIAKKQNYSGKSQIIDCMELQEIEDSTMLSAKIMGYLVLFFLERE